MSNYLPLMIRETLVKTGWNENEIAVYSVLLEKGAMSLTDISEELSIPVPTLQYVMRKLLTKKMITKLHHNNRPLYAVTRLDQLQKWMKGYTKQFQMFEVLVKDFIDQYDFNPEIYTPKIRFFEGVKGVKQSYRQILKECEGGEIKSFFSAKESVEKDLHVFFREEYLQKRIKKGILSKNIALKNTLSANYLKNKEKYLIEMKLVSRDFFPMTNTELNIYDDVVHCMSFTKKGSFALIIRDDSFSSILNSIFEMLWFSADRFTFYEGLDGVKASYLNILDDCQEGEIKSIFSVKNKEDTQLLDFFKNSFIPKGIEKNIEMRNIGIENNEVENYLNVEKKDNRETRSLPRSLFSNEEVDINIYDNVMHFMNAGKGKDSFAMTFRDKGVVSMLKSIFEMLWFLTDKIEVFEGIEGIKQSYYRIIDKCKTKKMVGFFSVIEDEQKELQDFFVNDYVPLRVKKKIYINNIATRTKKSLAYKKRDKDELRKTVLVDKKFFPIVNSEVNLFDDCLHCMSFNNQQGFAFIVNDKNLVLIIKGLFQMVWTTYNDPYEYSS